MCISASCGQRRLWSDCAYVQADLRFAGHTSLCLNALADAQIIMSNKTVLNTAENFYLLMIWNFYRQKNSCSFCKQKPVKIFVSSFIFEPAHEISTMWHSDQCRLRSAFWILYLSLEIFYFVLFCFLGRSFMQTVKALIRQCVCADWSEPSLGYTSSTVCFLWIRSFKRNTVDEIREIWCLKKLN